jgi:hypothetical protein
MLARVATGATRPASTFALLAVRIDQPRDVLAILLDEVADPLTALTRTGSGVLDRATKSNVIANVIRTGLRPQVLDIRLLHLELTRGIPAIVGFLTI